MNCWQLIVWFDQSEIWTSDLPLKRQICYWSTNWPVEENFKSIIIWAKQFLCIFFYSEEIASVFPLTFDLLWKSWSHCENATATEVISISHAQKQKFLWRLWQSSKKKKKRLSCWWTQLFYNLYSILQKKRYLRAGSRKFSAGFTCISKLFLSMGPRTTAVYGFGGK